MKFTEAINKLDTVQLQFHGIAPHSTSLILRRDFAAKVTCSTSRCQRLVINDERGVAYHKSPRPIIRSAVAEKKRDMKGQVRA